MENVLVDSPPAFDAVARAAFIMKRPLDEMSLELSKAELFKKMCVMDANRQNLTEAEAEAVASACVTYVAGTAISVGHIFQPRP
jgi:hypothetical protein